MVNGASFATAYYMTGWWSLGTVRGATRHIFSMRKANDREKARLSPYFKV
jgi:hypothetical protein